MTLFLGSMSVVCAFVLGVAFGCRWMFRIYFSKGGAFDRMQTDAATTNVLASSYAYSQIRESIDRGESLASVSSFVDRELARLAEAGTARGQEIGEQISHARSQRS